MYRTINRAYYSTKSTFIDIGNPDAQYGQTLYNVIGSNSNPQATDYPQTGTECVALYSFNVSIPSNAIGISGYVSLTCFYSTNNFYGPGISMFSASPWDVSTISWNTQPYIQPAVFDKNYTQGFGTYTFNDQYGLYSSMNDEINYAFVLNSDLSGDAGSQIDMSNPTGWSGFFMHQALFTFHMTYQLEVLSVGNLFEYIE